MASGKSDILNIYCTAGYPRLDDTPRILKALEKAGVDIIELGMPFSDPLADGPVIQASSMQALENGMSIELLFEQLHEVNISVPIILMGYLNPVLQYGIERFVMSCVECGVAGAIIPDLPPALYALRYRQLFESNGISNICLVTPQTSRARIKAIDDVCTGFIYAVSSASTTGSKSDLSNIDDYLRGLSEMGMDNPILTGFNIKDADSFARATKYTRGGIIGSAFIKAMSKGEDLDLAIQSFVKSIRS
jgi:tryptophan synthase alpha chain